MVRVAGLGLIRTGEDVIPQERLGVGVIDGEQVRIFLPAVIIIVFLIIVGYGLEACVKLF